MGRASTKPAAERKAEAIEAASRKLNRLESKLKRAQEDGVRLTDEIETLRRRVEWLNAMPVAGAGSTGEFGPDDNDSLDQAAWEAHQNTQR